MNLVTAAVESGIINDLGSGSSVDICVLKKDPKVDVKVDYMKWHKQDNHRINPSFPYNFKGNNTRKLLFQILVKNQMNLFENICYFFQFLTHFFSSFILKSIP